MQSRGPGGNSFNQGDGRFDSSSSEAPAMMGFHSGYNSHPSAALQRGMPAAALSTGGHDMGHAAAAMGRPAMVAGHAPVAAPVQSGVPGQPTQGMFHLPFSPPPSPIFF